MWCQFKRFSRKVEKCAKIVFQKVSDIAAVCVFALRICEKVGALITFNMFNMKAWLPIVSQRQCYMTVIRHENDAMVLASVLRGIHLYIHPLIIFKMADLHECTG
jgi:hypothetical protein